MATEERVPVVERGETSGFVHKKSYLNHILETLHVRCVCMVFRLDAQERYRAVHSKQVKASLKNKGLQLHTEELVRRIRR